LLRVTQKGQYWRPHEDDITLNKYGSLLHALAHAILITLEDSSPSDYRFPLSDTDKESGGRLRDLLANGTSNDCVKALHNFIFPFLSGREFTPDYNHAEYSKWQETLECFLAVYCLKDDGSFKSPQDVTGIFAKVEYLCRGSTLYEGLTRIADFQNDPYK
jgi:hypothetical protein